MNGRMMAQFSAPPLSAFSNTGKCHSLRPLSFCICKIGIVVPALKIVVLVLKIFYFYRILKGLYLKTSSLSYTFPFPSCYFQFFQLPSGYISKQIVCIVMLIKELSYTFIPIFPQCTCMYNLGGVFIIKDNCILLQPS